MTVRRPGFRGILFFLLFASLSLTAESFAFPWLPFGPDGGDARRFAPDPHNPQHIFLGTANGWLYETHDGGSGWVRLSRPGRRDDLVLDGIVIDPTNSKHLTVGAWVVGASDGGLYSTYDGGVTWVSQADMRGQSVRALTESASNPQVLVAGTLKGVYKSEDGGRRWKLISPPDSTEIHEVQSVAIDPQNPDIIYAGTWHLPWKTVDGGTNWESIKTGIIEDSDVFSIIVDPTAPKIVYASACSGIYKSEDAGAQFHKVEGIPSSARRTRVLLQDPTHLETVFAGTTEGLFRSEDSGKAWHRTTEPDVIVNDVYVDESDSHHVLIATNRGGVLASEDGGDTFHPSNGGFSARQITALKRDATQPARIFVGVVNDKEWGGVFQSDNGGVNWVQRSTGLAGRDVFSLDQAPDGTMIAGTAHGIFRLDEETGTWNQVENMPSGNGAEAPMVLPVAVRSPVQVHRNEFVERTGLKRSSVQSPQHKLRGAALTKRPVLRRPEKRKASLRARPTARAHKRKSQQLRPAGADRAAARKGKARNLVIRGGPPTVSASSRAAAERSTAAPPEPKPFDGSVFALVTSDSTVLAATSDGLMLSEDNGLSWKIIGSTKSSDCRYLAAAKQDIVAASLHDMHFSNDSGGTWVDVKLPAELTQISAVSVEPSGEMWVGGPEGVFVSPDAGVNWTTPKNLFVRSVTSIYYDDASNRVFVTAGGAADVAFIVQLPAKSVTFAQTGWKLRFVRPVGDHLVGATFFDGVVIQPRMIATPEAGAERASR